MNKGKNIAAFFDIDGTLYRENLITSMFKKFVKSEIIDGAVWYKDLKDKYDRWDQRLGNYDDYLLKMAEIYIESIKGLHFSQVNFIAKKVIEQEGDRIYSYTRERIKFHKENNHKIFAISGSPIELVSEMSKKYNFNDFRGTIYKLNSENVYTGEIVPMWDKVSKEKELKNFSEKYNIDLENSYAYGDTTGDISMFQNVGNPITINPTKELMDFILQDEHLKNKVSIIIERKNIVYNLSPKIIINNSVF